jgi:hypothetical protein
MKHSYPATCSCGGALHALRMALVGSTAHRADLQTVDKDPRHKSEKESQPHAACSKHVQSLIWLHFSCSRKKWADSR